MSPTAAWIEKAGVLQVECLVADMNGILRGKTMPTAQFLAGEAGDGIRLASSLLNVTIMGAYASRPGHDDVFRDPDMILRPDPESLAVASGCETPTAWVFADPVHPSGAAWAIAPRQVLKALAARYAQKGWRCAIAPELEFYLTAPQRDPCLPVSPAPGADGRPLPPSPGGAEALAGHADFIGAVTKAAQIAGLPTDTAICESGAGQLEINLAHGDPVRRADQTLVFKRVVRMAAKAGGMNATFMAQPLERHAASGMHLHLSLADAASGRNLFADEAGGDTPLFLNFLGGLQRYLPQIAPLYAPSVNSFRRMRPRYSSPVNVAWGRDNRTCGLRIPLSDTANRRVEIRLAGADANPYLAMAAALAAGWRGITEAIAPAPEAAGNAYDGARPLPRTLEAGLERLAACAPVRDLLGEPFITTFLAVKEAELEDFRSALTPWERDHLLRQI